MWGGFSSGIIYKEETENMKVINASYSTVLWTCRSSWSTRELGKTSHSSRIAVMTSRKGSPGWREIQERRPRGGPWFLLVASGSGDFTWHITSWVWNSLEGSELGRGLEREFQAEKGICMDEGQEGVVFWRGVLGPFMSMNAVDWQKGCAPCSSLSLQSCLRLAFHDSWE